MKERLLSFMDTVSFSTMLGTLCVSLLGVVVLVLALNRFGDESVTEADADVEGAAQTVEVSPTGPTTTEAPPEPPDPFYVIGSDIVDPNGQVHVPVGANVAISVVDFPYVFEGGNGGVAGRIDEIKAWGWNTVRANLVCDDVDGVGQDDVIGGIADTIEELTAAELVVIITCHDGGGTNVTINDETEERLREFWDIIVENYRDNPYVWFNFFNEPWELSDEDALAQWHQLHEFYVNRYRNQGVENVVVVDIPAFAQAIDLLADDPFADDLIDQCNVVFGWHAWGDLGGEQATTDGYRVKALAARAKGMAIVITEAGVPDPLEAGTAGFPAWNVSGFDAALDLASTEDFGLLWWHGTGDTDDELFYPLTADATGFWTAADGSNLSEAGQRFWDFSQTARPATPFEGSVVRSDCPSALGQ